MKVLKAKGKRIGMAQSRENRRKRCSHTKEFWVRKGQCALPHLDVLRQKGLAPNILLGPCCLSAIRGVAIKWPTLRIPMASLGYIRTVNRALEIWTQASQNTTLKGSSNQLQEALILAGLHHWGYLNSGLLSNALPSVFLVFIKLKLAFHHLSLNQQQQCWIWLVSTMQP